MQKSFCCCALPGEPESRSRSRDQPPEQVTVSILTGHVCFLQNPRASNHFCRGGNPPPPGPFVSPTSQPPLPQHPIAIAGVTNPPVSRTEASTVVAAAVAAVQAPPLPQQPLPGNSGVSAASIHLEHVQQHLNAQQPSRRQRKSRRKPRVPSAACPVCQKLFTSNYVLERHVKSVHDKIKDVKCPQCDYVTSYPTHLKEHERSVHLKIKDQACHLCEFRTSIKGSLDRHIR